MQSMKKKPSRNKYKQISSVHNQQKQDKLKKQQNLSLNNQSMNDQIGKLNDQQIQINNTLSKQSSPNKRLKCLCTLCSCGQHSCKKFIEQNKIKNIKIEQPLSKYQKQKEDNPEEQTYNLLQSLKKCSNRLIRASPFNYGSSYLKDYKKPSIRYRDQGVIHQKSKLPYNPKFYKLDGKTIYRKDFIVQSKSLNSKEYMNQKYRQMNNRSLNIGDSNQYYDSRQINGVNYRQYKPYQYSHHYGNQYQRITTEQPLIKHQLQALTEYKRQYEQKKQINPFVNSMSDKKSVNKSQIRMKSLDFKLGTISTNLSSLKLQSI